MSQKKLPPEAFEFYYRLGPGRSYQQVADEFGSSKTAVANLADRETWQDRVLERDDKAREDAARETQAELDKMRKRHFQLLRYVEQRAIEKLKATPLEKAADAVKALEMVIRNERTLHGEPTERTAVSVEETIKREYARWMSPVEDVPEHRAGADDIADNEKEAS